MRVCLYFAEVVIEEPCNLLCKRLFIRCLKKFTEYELKFSLDLFASRYCCVGIYITLTQTTYTHKPISFIFF